MSLYAESEPNISTQRKDIIILETISQPDEITSAIVGHFLNRKQQTLILAKQTILSIFNYDSETQQFHLLDHKPTFKQVFSIHQVPQQNMLDCIVVITINGEGMLLQWHENDFFPLAVGQYLDAALNVMENPLRRRIQVNPTFQQYVQIIPIDQHTNSQLSKPIQTQKSKLLNENDTKQVEAQSNIVDEDLLNYERVLARSVCFIDECVCSGIIYDGPGSDLMYDISNNYDEILENIPQMFDWGDEYEATIENGLEHIWKDKQKLKQRKNKEQLIQEKKKEKIVIAQSQIFIFAEEESSDIIGGKSLIMDSIIRYHYITYMNSMILSDFPFNQSDDRDHSFDEIVNIYAIVDTAEGVCLLSINLDFSKQTMKLGPFVMIGIPSYSSRIITLRNDLYQNCNKFADDIAHQALKGSEQVEVEQIDKVKDYDLLIALRGQKIVDDDKIQQQETTNTKKLKKLIRHKIKRSEMLSIQINHNDSDHPSFVPYILASSKAIILQQSISQAFIFPFPNALPIPPFGFCHVYVEDRTELQLEQQQENYHQFFDEQTKSELKPKSNKPQFNHKLLLGGGKDILTIQNGQIHQQHYETKCINNIIIIQTKINKIKTNKQKTKIQNYFQHTTAVVTTTSGFPILMQLETGNIQEVDDDDDFCLPTGNIQQVINIPPKWKNQLQIQEDRMALGVAHGISGRGEIQIVSVGHKLKEIIRDDWSCNKNTKLFSSQYFAGFGAREFLLAQQEIDDEKLLSKSEFPFDINSNSPLTQTSQSFPSPESDSDSSFTHKLNSSIFDYSNQVITSNSPQNKPQNNSIFPELNDNSLINNKMNNQLDSTSHNQIIKKTYITKLFQINEGKITSLDPTSFRFNPNQRIIAFHEIQGGMTFITENEVTIYCTMKYQGKIKQIDEEEMQYKNYINAKNVGFNGDIIKNDENQSFSSSLQNSSSSSSEYSSSIISSTNTSTQSTSSILTSSSSSIQSTSSESQQQSSGSSSLFNPIVTEEQIFGLQPKSIKDKIVPNQSSLKLHHIPLKHTIQVVSIQESPIIDNNATGTKWNMPPWFTKEESQKIYQENLNISDMINQCSLIPHRQVTIDHAAVGDNIIVVSHKNIVYVLLWHPAIPIILQQKKQIYQLNSIMKLTLLAYQSLQNNNKIEQDPLFFHEQHQLKVSMHIQAVCTLKFTSNVTSLGAATICGHQYFVVCTQDPNRGRIFRLNSFEDDVEFQKENKKIWEFVRDPKNQQTQVNQFNVLKFPDDNPQVPPNQQFIEAQLGDNEFLLNFCCLQLTVTPIIDMKLNNPASSCLLTTLERSVKRLGPEEDIIPNETLFGMSIDCKQIQQNDNKRHQKHIHFSSKQQPLYKNINSSENDQQYQAHEGALLLIGGQYGLTEFVVIPLAQLMLDASPHRYSSAMDVLKIGIQSREYKLQNSIHELFTFPPESQFMDLGRSPVSIAEDNRRVIIKGERTYAVRFDPYLGRTVWLSLFNYGGIRSIVPVGVLQQQKLKQNLQKKQNNKQKLNNYQSKMKLKLDIQKTLQQTDQFQNQEDQDSTSVTSTSDEQQSSSDLENEDHKSKSNELKIPNPEIVWIGNDKDSFISFGVISKQQRMNKQVQQLPSLPIAITHIPSLHAIAVLFREEYKYLNVDIEIEEEIQQNKEDQDNNTDQLISMKNISNTYQLQKMIKQQTRQISNIKLKDQFINKTDKKKKF